MKKIYKYQLRETIKQRVDFPVGAKFLSIQNQGNVACVWCEVDPDEDLIVPHMIRMVGTGHEAPESANTFLGTVQFGPFVFHYYTNIGEDFLK